MRVSVVAGAAAMLILAGCAQQQIDKGLSAHVGQPVSTLIAKLNYPDRQTTISGQRAFIWGFDRPAEASIFTPTAPSGRVGRPATLASNAMAMSPVDHACQIRVVVDDSYRVVSWDSRGNEGGCAPYARRLAP